MEFGRNEAHIEGKDRLPEKHCICSFGTQAEEVELLDGMDLEVSGNGYQDYICEHIEKSK